MSRKAPPIEGLRDVLAQIYRDKDSASNVVDEAGLISANIPFTNHAKNNWHAILIEAVNEDRLTELARVVFKEYGTNTALFDAYTEYLKEEAGTKGRVGPSHALTSPRRSWGAWIGVPILILLAGLSYLAYFQPSFLSGVWCSFLSPDCIAMINLGESSVGQGIWQSSENNDGPTRRVSGEGDEKDDCLAMTLFKPPEGGASRMMYLNFDDGVINGSPNLQVDVEYFYEGADGELFQLVYDSTDRDWKPALIPNSSEQQDAIILKGSKKRQQGSFLLEDMISKLEGIHGFDFRLHGSNLEGSVHDLCVAKMTVYLGEQSSTN